MSILTLESKREENFQSKKKRRKISNQRKKREEREFPIKEWEKAKRKERKFPIKEWEKEKREEEREESSRSKKNNMQKGLWTGQYLNNTELSPNE